MSVRCLFGFHRFPKKAEKEAEASFDIFDYLLHRCERCGKRRRDT